MERDFSVPTRDTAKNNSTSTPYSGKKKHNSVTFQKFPFKKDQGKKKFNTGYKGDKGNAAIKPKYLKGRARDLNLTFNEDDRKEFLTGFHKRKLARQALGKKINEKKKRDELREQRKKKRAVLKDRLEELEQIEEYFNLINNPDETPVTSSTTHQVDDEEFEVEVTTTMSLPAELNL